MLRLVSAALRGTTRVLTSAPARSAECRIPSILTKSEIPTVGFDLQARYLSRLCLHHKTATCNGKLFSPCSSPSIPTPKVLTAVVPVRTLTKFTRHKGKRQTVKTVVRRFYRLDWGMWIRTKAGRKNHLWKKTWKRKGRLRRHVMTNSTQSHLLDTMVCKYWRRPKYYVDDPYNPYHKRESYFLTRTKPW